MTDPADPADRTAVVLADGPAPEEGRHLALPRVVARAAGVADDVVVSCQSADAEAIRETLANVAPTARVAADPVSGQGAVYALMTSLRLARGEYAVVTAPGRPPADAPTVDALAAALTDGNHDCAAPVLDGEERALPGLYAVDRTRTACDVALARDVQSLSGLVELLDSVGVSGTGIRDAGPATDAADAGTFAE